MSSVDKNKNISSDIEKDKRKEKVEPPLSNSTIDIFQKQSQASFQTIIHSPREDTQESQTDDQLDTIGKYQIIGELGEGGMGIVYRAKDPTLNRIVALKILHNEFSCHRSLLLRFSEEAQVVAQLQHPNIIPLYDYGQFADGRLYYTMKEVRGQTLTKLIQDYHNQQMEWSLRRMVQILVSVCDAIAYAHDYSVFHRDLKPENIMIGEFGEVYVMDWGIAKVLNLNRDFQEESIITDRRRHQALLTRMGQITGTPSYMSPEQANGNQKAIGSHSDVYSVGAMLYECIRGQPPFIGSNVQDILGAVRNETPPCLRQWLESNPGKISVHMEELLRICKHAMERDIEQRIGTATRLRKALQDWLDGTQLHQKAQEKVQRAKDYFQELNTLERKKEKLREEIQAIEKQVKTYEPEHKKHKLWRLQNQLQQLLVEEDHKIVAIQQEIAIALNFKSNLDEAHGILAELYLRQHALAESKSIHGWRQRVEPNLRYHVDQLSHTYERKQEFLDYLQGDGKLYIETVQDDVEVWIGMYETKNQRLVLSTPKYAGNTPFQEVFQMGSYMAILKKEGYDDLLYPFNIQRKRNWDSKSPSISAKKVSLAKKGHVRPDECYVPAGWFLCGSNNQSMGGFPRTWLWVNGFVIQRYQVTNRQYLEFLNDLVRQGDEEKALECVPRERSGSVASDGKMLYQRDADGYFSLTTMEDGGFVALDWPVILVSALACFSYAEWYAQKTGEPWRLPSEFEWEKAARGVDGRLYPWGNHFDHSWCNCLGHFKDSPSPISAQEALGDISPYGVIGMAGNVSDITQTKWKENAKIVSNIAPPPSSVDGEKTDFWIIRGGSWYIGPSYLRSANRFRCIASMTYDNYGFRLCRSYNGKSIC